MREGWSKEDRKIVPVKTLLIDGNCRVENRCLKTQHGHMVCVLSIYNKREKNNRMTMAAFNIQEGLIWKEKIESVIDQHQESQGASGNKYISFEYKSGMDSGRNGSSSDRESQFSAGEDEDDSHANLLRRTTIGNGLPESVVDWTKELDSDLSNQNSSNQAFSRKYWHLLQCQNGLRLFEELLDVDFLPRSCSRAMKAVGVVEASCEEIFELVMSMDAICFEWDCSFQYGSLVEEVDGHTAILYHRLQLNWFPMFVWPRDLCYVRYWRRNDDGSYGGGYNISPLKPRNGRPRTQVQHLMQIDVKGWGVGYISSFQQHCLFQMLNSVAGLREYFSQTDERAAAPRIPVMVNMTSASISSKKSQNEQEASNQRTASVDIVHAANRNASMIDEFSDEDEDSQGADQEVIPPSSDNEMKRTALKEPLEQIDLSIFSGNLQRNDNDNGRNCWQISDGNNFRVRSRNFCYDKSEVASEKGLFSLLFNLQVPGSTHYSMVFYFVMKELAPDSLLQRFVDGDDDFRNSRMKLLPSVPKGSWIVRQSVGSTPSLLGKAVDCNYIRGPAYLEVDIDIGSSTVANGVLGLVIGVITTLVVDMAFLVQANTPDELPERLIGAVRVSHAELSSAIVPKLAPDTPS
ncbi:protein ENHANCED DISEASE RESISTANCE 2-like isoform X5 [Lycium ferocissimum]|uniref:protein ENHANCED DISEASE RESISTANCE 2-like isoform X5 n=1 Tax=Lycium ferocissimum TaxID=112874 RepID=UPI0028156DB7|nr:protein ENHANCED DISEASE RESISTANCE 2-like isoform X5 [Lycium ferocissimum]